MLEYDAATEGDNDPQDALYDQADCLKISAKQAADDETALIEDENDGFDERASAQQELDERLKVHAFLDRQH